MYVSLNRQINFLMDLYEWLKSGAGIEKSIIGFELALQGNRRGRELVWLTGIKKSVQRGQSIAQGLGSDFSPRVVMMVRMGQAYGCLGPILHAFSAQKARDQAALGGWFKKMSYPIILCLVACIALIFIGTQVLPRFADQGGLSAMQAMTTPAIVVHELANVLVIVLPLCVSLFALSSIGLYWLLPAKATPGRKHVESLYVFRVYRRIQLIAFLRTSVILLQHQVSLATVLKELKELSTPYLGNYLRVFLQRVRRGEFDIARLFRSRLVEHDILFRLQCQNPSLALDIRLQQLADYVEGDLARLLGRGQLIIASICYALAGTFTLLLFIALASMMQGLAQGAL